MVATPVMKTALLAAVLLLSAGAYTAPTVAAARTIQVGIRLHQIVAVDQKRKNFTAVISLKGRWHDPLLAYPPEQRGRYTALDKDAFRALMRQRGSIFPTSIIYNQQGRLFTHNSLVSITPEGDVSYLQQATVSLQASHFDFRRFPFDSQRFEIILDNLFPTTMFRLTPLPGYSAVSDRLGTEEWVVTGFETRLGTTSDTTGGESSRFTFAFTAHRNAFYYLIKIFLPVALILLVSWLSFFLKDYGKRIDMGSTNLLLFIAFNFTISNELPKLGYITFLDAFLIITFVITALAVLVNIVLKRLHDAGRADTAAIIDRHLLAAYPLLYGTAIALTAAFTL